MEETETTNKVLETKIEGLIKLTDERFSNIKESLTRIEQNNLGFATKSELEDAKKDFNKSVDEIKQGFLRHNEDDKISFGKITGGQDELRSIILKWIGALAVMVFLLPIIIPLIFHYWLNF